MMRGSRRRSGGHEDLPELAGIDLLGILLRLGDLESCLEGS